MAGGVHVARPGHQVEVRRDRGLGFPAALAALLTTLKEEQARLTAQLIADVLDKPHDEANIAAVRAKVAALTKDFPVYR